MGNKSSLMLRDEEIKQLSEETGFSSTQIEKLYSRFAHLDRSNSGSLSKNDLMSIPELAINPLCDRLIHMFFSQSDQVDVDERINFRQFVKVFAAFKSNSSSPNAALKKSMMQKNTSYDNDNNNDTHAKDGIELFHMNGLHSGVRLDDPATSFDRKISQHSSQPPSILNENLRDKLLFVFKIYDADNDGKISFGDLRSILKMMVGNYIEDVQLDKIATRAFVEVDQDSDGFIEFSEFCRVFAGKDLDDKLRVKFFS